MKTFGTDEKLFAARLKLKTCGFSNVYINEDLPKKKSELPVFFLVRKAKSEKLVKSVWTSSGSIIVRLLNDKELVVDSMDDINKISGFNVAKYKK